MGVLGSIPGLGRSPGEENGCSFQYSCLKNSMDRGAQRAIVYEVTKSQMQMSDSHFPGGSVVKNPPANAGDMC